MEKETNLISTIFTLKGLNKIQIIENINLYYNIKFYNVLIEFISKGSLYTVV